MHGGCVFLCTPHQLEPLASAQGLVGLSLWEVVFGPAVRSQLDGLLRGRLVFLVHLTELLEEEALEVPEVPARPLVAGVCEHKGNKKGK